MNGCLFVLFFLLFLLCLLPFLANKRCIGPIIISAPFFLYEAIKSVLPELGFTTTSLFWPSRGFLAILCQFCFWLHIAIWVYFQIRHSLATMHSSIHPPCLHFDTFLLPHLYLPFTLSSFVSFTSFWSPFRSPWSSLRARGARANIETTSSQVSLQYAVHVCWWHQFGCSTRTHRCYALWHTCIGPKTMGL